MPVYKTSGAVNISGIIYQDGASLTLSSGSVRDELLAAGAIFRPDLLPYASRGLAGGFAWVPAERIKTPGRNHLAVPSQNPVSEVCRGWAYGANTGRPLVWYGFLLRPLDEWSLTQWPWGGPWMVAAMPSKPFRLIP